MNCQKQRARKRLNMMAVTKSHTSMNTVGSKNREVSEGVRNKPAHRLLNIRRDTDAASLPLPALLFKPIKHQALHLVLRQCSVALHNTHATT
eukprot:1161405-Pelagomonas_calceolata.AAC.4